MASRCGLPLPRRPRQTSERRATTKPGCRTPSGGKDGWRSNRPDSPAASLPPLTAPAGVTAVAGQVLRLNGQPLPDVTLEIDGNEATSDRTGRFLLLLPNVAAGHHELEIDGRTANRGKRT